MKTTIFLLTAVLFLCIGCQKKAIIIGDFNGDNRVTFEQLRENPEPYMFKEISFEVGERNVIGPGVDVTSDDDKELSFDFLGQKSGSIRKVIDAYENGDTSFIPDAGAWFIFYNSILPIQMEGLHPPFDHLENKYSIPLEYIDTNENEFIFTSENTDSLVFSGILFESASGMMRDSLGSYLKKKHGKYFGHTLNKVYLTGAKIIPH